MTPTNVDGLTKPADEQRHSDGPAMGAVIARGTPGTALGRNRGAEPAVRPRPPQNGRIDDVKEIDEHRTPAAEISLHDREGYLAFRRPGVKPDSHGMAGRDGIEGRL